MKIGFIATRGVRVHNAELTKLGLTLPGFVDRNRIIAIAAEPQPPHTGGPDAVPVRD